MKQLLLILMGSFLMFACGNNPLSVSVVEEVEVEVEKVHLSQLKYEASGPERTPIMITGSKHYFIEALPIITELKDFSGKYVQIFAWSYRGETSVKISQKKFGQSEWIVLGTNTSPHIEEENRAAYLGINIPD